MRDLMGEVKKMLSDPKTIRDFISKAEDAFTALSDPATAATMSSAMKKDIAAAMEDWDSFSGDDDTSADKSATSAAAAAAALASVFDTGELREMLDEPKKWKKAIDEGRQQLKSDGAGSKPKPIPVNLKRRGGGMDEM